MTFTVQIKGMFPCTLERAFRTPMLCDVAKVHTGYGLMPRITHSTDDAGWGQPGSTKKVYAAPSATQAGGYASLDRVLEREENRYWKIEVSDFQSWMLSFYKFVGEWATREVSPGQVEVTYTYHLYAANPLWYPVNWLFAKTFWRRYMHQAMENVRQMAIREEPYLYA